MAGPMMKRDCLYGVMLVLTLLIMVTIIVATFYLRWFSVTRFFLTQVRTEFWDVGASPADPGTVIPGAVCTVIRLCTGMWVLALQTLAPLCVQCVCSNGLYTGMWVLALCVQCVYSNGLCSGMWVLALQTLAPLCVQCVYSNGLCTGMWVLALCVQCVYSNGLCSGMWVLALQTLAPLCVQCVYSNTWPRCVYNVWTVMVYVQGWMWVLALQTLAPLCVALCMGSLLLQLVNLALAQRHYGVQGASLCCMAASGLLLTVTGHIALSKYLWTFSPHREDNVLVIQPLVSGLFLLCSVLAAAVCVITHVSSHCPGPLSVYSSLLSEAKFFAPRSRDLNLELEMVEQGISGEKEGGPRCPKVSVRIAPPAIRSDRDTGVV
ncbi:hypothetical protein ACOMHN_015167 [Nucella lapillus]